MSEEELAEMQKKLREYIDLCWIWSNTIPFGAPIISIKKQEGILRMCMAYRLMNEKTINAYPIL